MEHHSVIAINTWIFCLLYFSTGVAEAGLCSQNTKREPDSGDSKFSDSDSGTCI